MSEKATVQEAAPWDIPAIDGSDGRGFLTAGRLQQLQQDAHEEAWKKGHEEGVVAGQNEIAERAKRYDELLLALSKPFDELEESVEGQLLELCIAIVRTLFRREIKIDPTHIIGVVRDAIRTLPVASRSVQVHLHPDDASLVRDSLSPAEGEPAWTIVEDPLISHGGCRVTSSSSQIDATAESRLHAVICQCLGDERVE